MVRGPVTTLDQIGSPADARAPENSLVSVIVPAFNAEATLDETLRSVRAQTYKNLDIIVVDDGSADSTLAVAERHAEQDMRVRVIAQQNAGVAAARNRGIAEARGELVAPVDADDLWRPNKILQQVRAISTSLAIGLCYTWSAIITEQSRVRSLTDQPTEEGDVLAQLCRANFVGNGSSALMRRDLILQVGGFDESLRARSAQGCEDWKLYLQIAERSHFALVRDHLTGYRLSASNMSSDVLQMLRSHEFVCAEYRERYPEYADIIREGRESFLEWLLWRALNARHFPNAQSILREMYASDRSLAVLSLQRMIRSFLKNLLQGRLSAGSAADPMMYLQVA